MGAKETTLVTVIGSINADLVADVKQLPQRGETIHATGFQQHLGGKGANQAVATAVLGGRVDMVGCVGDDGPGTEALQGLDRVGVNREQVRVVSGVPTGTALITVDEQGNNTIVVVPGANDALKPEDVRALRSRLEQSAAVVLQLESPDEAVLAAAKTVAELRAWTDTGQPWLVFNPSPFRTSALPPEGSIDLLLVNELEAESMSGVKVNNPRDAAVAAERLLAQLRTGGCVVVTLGAQGAVALADPAGPFARRVDGAADKGVGSAAGAAAAQGTEPSIGSDTVAVPGNGPSPGSGGGEAGGSGAGPSAAPLFVPALKVDAVDTTGAGDVFTGGLVSQLCAGRSLDYALRFATAAAAITVTRPGAQSSFPRPDEVEQLLAQVEEVQVLAG